MYVMQLCHNYKQPFLRVAAQYASLFKESPYKVITVYLKGAPSRAVVENSKSYEVIFLNLKKNDLRGLKRRAIRSVKSLHARYQFQLAIAHRYKPIFIATHMKDLFVVGVHHIDSVYKRWTRRWYVRGQKDRLVLLGVSKAIRDDIQSWLPDYPQDKIVYLYNSLNFGKIRSKQLSRGDSRSHLGLSQEAFVIGSVGRLHPDKDQATLVSAFARAAPNMPGALLAIVGTGRLKDTLEQLILKLNMRDRILLLGMIPDAYRYYRAFDAFVLSSIREGLPVALLEAFAARNICAASRCNGNFEAVEGVGYSFDVGDDAMLSQILQQIYHLSDEERAAMRIKMENKINSNFTEERMRQAFWLLPAIAHFRGKTAKMVRQGI
jgi:glycosyltransferase involved in cell wall biosynthesis